MRLKQYEGKNIRIIDVDGQIFEGLVTDYIHAGEDDTGLESIIVNCTKGWLKDQGVEFWEKDIKSIEVI